MVAASAGAIKGDMMRIFDGLHHDWRAAQGRAPVVVFVNSLGTDFRLWDRVVARLPGEWGILRHDMRGHGLSSLPGPVSIDGLARDVAALIDHHGIARFVGVGLSVGGMVMQRLARGHADRISHLMLADTGAVIGDAALWNARIDAVLAGGVAAIAPQILARWFPPAYHATDDFQLWRLMLERTPREGYAAVSAAIRDADLTADLARITPPVLTVAGAHDGSTPPAMMRQMTAQIPRARFVEIPDAGHLPCVDQPEAFAQLLRALVEGDA